MHGFRFMVLYFLPMGREVNGDAGTWLPPRTTLLDGLPSTWRADTATAPPVEEIPLQGVSLPRFRGGRLLEPPL